MPKGFFFTADLLGFSNIIRNSNAEERDVRVKRWINLVERSAHAEGIDRFQLISDTVFAGTDGSRDDLRRVIGFAQRLLNEGVRSSLPIRGAICHGEYEWGRLTYGPAVIAAHRLETAQNWIGVCCDIGMSHLNEFLAFHFLIVYLTPMKSGPMMLRAVVDWEVPSARELRSLMTKEGLMAVGEVFTWELGQKLNHTILFLLYRETVAQRGLSPAHYHGYIGMELIDMRIRGQEGTPRPL